MQSRLVTMLISLSIYASAICAVTLAPRIARAESPQAALHFEAGVRAFEEQRFADAASEFERSYQIQPAFEVLYNLGIVYAALGRPIEAVDAFERHLEQGGAAISRERHAEVERELDRQRAKLAQLDITVSEPGAELQLDAHVLGQAPFQRTFAVASGKHVVEVSLTGFQPQRTELNLSPGQTLRLAPTLVRVPARRVTMAPAAPSRIGLGQRIAGYVLGGAGLGTTVAGIVLVAKGQKQHFDAVDKANAGDRPEAEALESSADHKKLIGWTVTGIGGAALLGGIVLLWTAPNIAAPRASAHVFPWAAASSGGLVVEGRWP
jgi:tetratricopeptide (TPR) repeat protein